MTTIYVIIYITVKGWLSVTFASSGNVETGCYLPEDRPYSHFCIREVPEW